MDSFGRNRVPILCFITVLAMLFLWSRGGNGGDALRDDIGLKATCVLQGGGAVSGEINFVQHANVLRINGQISGLAPGPHGFHIHQWGDVRDGCKAAGAHFNPHRKSHGAPSDSERHVGDFGNVVANADGVAEVQLSDALATLKSIVGRAVVVHAGVDDLGRGSFEDSLTTGHAGARLGVQRQRQRRARSFHIK